MTIEHLHDLLQQAHNRLTIQSGTIDTLLVLYEAQRSELAVTRAELAALKARVILTERPINARLTRLP